LQENPFEVKGEWYKGNLHCHSTVSDGILSPVDVAEMYRKNGWNFLAFTEHSIFTNWEDLNRDDFLIIPGVEISIDESNRPRCYHLVGIQKDSGSLKHRERIDRYYWQGPASVQLTIDTLKEKGFYVILCHPIWSRTEFEDFKDFNGYFGIEIYNYGCEMESHTGLSTVYWDSLLRRGKKVWGLATDDAHHRIKDEMGGWVMVKVDELTKEKILDALIDGKFYASSGPIINYFGIQDGEVIVECSPANAIHFVTYESTGASFYAEDKPLRSARFKLRGDELYVRVECVDEYSRVAWSNPIFLSGLR
jgi:hypothetical protein